VNDLIDNKKELKYYFTHFDFCEIYCEKIEYKISSQNKPLLLISEKYLLVIVEYVEDAKIILNGTFKYNLKVNEALLIYPYSSINIESKNIKFWVLEFDGDVIRKLYKEKSKIEKLYVTKIVKNILSEIYDKIINKKQNPDFLCISLIMQLLQGSKKNNNCARSESSVDEFIRYVKDNYNTNIKVNEICEIIGISVTHFTHKFSDEIGISPRQYIINLRIEKAKKMLKQSNVTIEEIARCVGYEYTTHFCREFKRISGFTPIEFKKSIYI